MVTEVSKNVFEEWYAIAIDAVEHRDAGSAYRILRTMDNFIASLDSTTRGNKEFQNEVSILRRQLGYVAFPELPLDQACRVLTSEIVSFVTSGISLDSQLSVRYDFTTYGEHEGERMALKKAILSNAEKIGTLGIGEWLQLFDTSFDPETREDRSILDFFTKEQRIVNLSRREQEILRVVLNVYEHWLAVEHLSLIDMANIYGQSSDNDLLPSQSERQVAPSYEKNTSAKEDVYQQQLPNESLPLLKALGKFEKLGGQQVTNSKIVVKGQNDPVRPTIFNWLRAYRDELGVGAHDAVTRGQFLFHSLNGKGLSSDERDQVGMLLKSLDENVPLTIDAGRQEVLFQRQGVEKSFSNSGRTAPIAERPLPIQTAVTPPAVRQPAESAVRGKNIENSGLTAPKAERPLFANTGNISRAVFELPAVQEQRISQTAVAPLKSGTTAPANRPSAFEQAKAIQQANRESRLSISNLASETVELGRMETPREENRAAVASPRPSIAPTPQDVAPAPRAISFEPAKIDNFSFGAGRGSDLQGIENSPPESLHKSLRAGGLTAPKAERPLFANDANVSALSFSTNHVMPAEKERIREQEIPNTIRQMTDQIPNAERPLPIPTPVQKTPTAPPVNRYRITPTGHRDTVASDDTPSPHVVDLRS